MNEVSIPRSAGILTVLVVLLVALTASVAFAATISCPNRANGLCVGTDNAYQMQGSLGNDIMRGRGGNDRLNGEKGNDTLLPQDGGDEVYGSSGDDVIRAYRDNHPDFINCGSGYAIADVQSGDYIDGERAGLLVGTTVTSCERIIVNGIVVVNTPRL